jgi:hypothetical protein
MSLGILANGNQFFRLPALGFSPASVNALYSGSSSNLSTLSRLSGYNIIRPVIIIPSDAGYPFTSTPAFWMATAIIPANIFGSRAASDIMFTALIFPLSNLKASNCDLSNGLAAICVSRAIILDCCDPLIPSSKTNRKMVHTASITTPQMTRHVATWWTDAEYFGDSNIIPAPTEKLAITLINSSEKWGQNGSKPPEVNALTYVSIGAIVSWLFVAGLATIRLVQSLYVVWREHHPKAPKGGSQNG